jgi:hypothetical protein
MSTNLGKYPHVYLHILCSHASFVKKGYFCRLCKKRQKMHREKAYFSTKNLKSTIFCVMSNNPMKQRFALEVGCQVNKKKRDLCC